MSSTDEPSEGRGRGVMLSDVFFIRVPLAVVPQVARGGKDGPGETSAIIQTGRHALQTGVTMIKWMKVLGLFWVFKTVPLDSLMVLHVGT